VDRQLVYPGAIPLDTDPLNIQRNVLVGLSKLAAAMLGTTTLLNGLACTPTGPASLQVLVAPGEIYSLQNLDGTAYGSLAADTTHQIVKQGVLLDQATLSCPAPATAGQSINYLIQVTYQDADTNAVVLPYYNASNPATAYSGPNNSGTAQNTQRKGQCIVAVKAGAAATTGSQTTPAPDAGYVGAWVVTVANGQTTITSTSISAYANAPMMPAGGLLVGGLQGSAANVSAAGGTADALTGTYTPAITALVNGMTLYVRAGSANATTTPTFTPASGIITAKTIVKGNGLALSVGDIAGGGHWIELQYDLTLDKWVLLNPASGVTTRGVQTVTANGNFTVPAGVTKIYVSACAGGGGGGGSAGNNGVANQAGGGGGGGAGQWIIRSPYTVTPGQVIAITIGAGGSAGGGGAAGVNAGTNGGAGGNTAIGSLITLTGGTGGAGGGNPGGANVGSGGGGGTGYPNGSAGDDGIAGCGGGAGASSPFGGGGPHMRGSQGSTLAGLVGNGYGSGAGGAGACWAAQVQAGAAGSAGMPGVAIIEW
jgi:hypothetical protein